MAGRETPIDVTYLIEPRSVAVIGASEDYSKFGGRITHHLVEFGFEGEIYPINPKRDEVLGHRCYPSIEAIGAQPDLALVAVPAFALLDTIEACGRAGVGACVVVTAQLGEFSEEGARLEREVVRVARAHNMRLIGPNCMGMILPSVQLALSSTPTLRYAGRLIRGDVALISQSGAMMGSLFVQAFDHGIGLSGMVSIGNQADLDLCDFLEAYIDHAATRVICLYIEGLPTPARFRALCLRAAGLGKQILAVKAGKTEEGTALAMSHTSSLAGSYSAFETLCREVGVQLIDDSDAMILLAGLIAANPLPRHDGIGVICASGGGGAVMADRFSGAGVNVVKFAEPTRAALDAHYPRSHQNNPLDLGGHKGGLEFEVFRTAIDAAYADAGVGIFVYVMTPQPMMEQCLAHVIGLWQRQEKPVLLVLNTSRFGEALRQQALEAGIPMVTRVDDLVRACQLFEAIAARGARPAAETPARPQDVTLAKLNGAGFLTEPEAKAILAGYGVSVPAAALGESEDEVAAAAARMGYPVVLKGVVPGVVHKSDSGLVKVGLGDEPALRTAFREIAAAADRAAPGAPLRVDVQQMIHEGVELIVGLSNEGAFGPQLVVGAGGIYVELLKDVAQRRAPVSPEAAREMLSELRIWPLLNGARGAAKMDVDAACEAISRFSWIGQDLSARLVDFEVNPLRVTESGVYALDGRGTLT